MACAFLSLANAKFVNPYLCHATAVNNKFVYGDIFSQDFLNEEAVS
jgi:hypothetical protein